MRASGLCRTAAAPRRFDYGGGRVFDSAPEHAGAQAKQAAVPARRRRIDGRSQMTEQTQNGAGGDAAPESTPQSVATPLTTAAIFLVLTIDEGGEDTVRALLPDVAGLRRAVAFRRPESSPEVVVGIGAEAWPRLFAMAPPAELHPFIELDGDRHHAPSTPGDLLFHIQAGSTGICFALADQIMTALRGAVTPVDEVHGFQFFDRRNLLGFVDGTENPEGAEAAEAVYRGPRDPLAGRSDAVTHQYMPDLD